MYRSSRQTVQLNENIGNLYDACRRGDIHVLSKLLVHNLLEIGCFKEVLRLVS